MAIKKRKLKGGVVRYEVAVTMGYEAVALPDGTLRRTRREHSKTFRTREEARRYWTGQQRAVDTGTFVEPCQTSLGKYLADEWLTGAVRDKVRPRTLRGYRDIVTAIRRHAVAEISLARLTAGALERYYADLLIAGTTGKRGLSPVSVRGIHSLIRSALRTAVRDRFLLANPSDNVTLPTRTRRDGAGLAPIEGDRRSFRALSREQVRALLDASARQPPPREGIRRNKKRWRYQPPGDRNRWHALWHVLVSGGLRPGEALGLQWPDIEWDRSRVNIVKALVRDGYYLKGWRLELPKTARSRRLVELPPETMDALGWHRMRQEAEKATTGQGYDDRGFVFATERGDPLDLKNVKRRHWWPLLAAAELPRVRVYDLRHTHCTLLLGAGVPVHVVSQRLGHSSARMTLDVYANYLPDQHEDAVARYRAYVGEKR